METIPSCLLSTVKEIKLHILVEDEQFAPQVALAMFFMQIGEKAELERFICKLCVDDWTYFESGKWMEVISSFPSARPHFKLRAAQIYSKQHTKTSYYCESSGWVEDV